MEKSRFNRILIILVILLLAFSFSTFAYNLRLNNRGSEVLEVQKYLAELGYELSTDGIFGSGTEEAVKDFQRSNNLTVDGIVGRETYQVLKNSFVEKVSYELYIVSRGDSLSNIANSRNLTVSEIKNFNKLTSERINYGQTLKIPVEAIGGNDQKQEAESSTYTVRRGDTLSQIANRNNLKVEDIIAKNNISSDFIREGQELRLPNSTNSQQSSNNRDNSSGSSENNLKHEVQPGESLSVIAQQYGTRTSDIRANNDLQGDRIYAGQELVIKGASRSGPIRLEKGSIIWPVRGRVTSEFGWRDHPVNNERSFHNGLDIAVPTGTDIKAAASGQVTHSGWMNGFGYTVVIDHGNNIETLYGHNSRLLVSRGENVQQGQRIALSGNTGMSTGPHLHFGVLRNDEPLDPRKYLP
ncbi:LysM peptidoglycan-binding domain-containing protein [Halanaerobium sp. Z-7514]|uniref:LysM peptidoglycan-binding domain-containing protein n=1 Tax=Halanaerobium polyolivorans TaxID=2886943 RepID=A0AAW4WZS6_9FIRM|nr:LysM peptidoglycan-binding domain-containing protein [Halanaerobium polyolivorans]MCC3144834.1 LysM peptidoglycan-binding domain-containing protein [Halanaerobium polyolivorans]